MRFADVHTLEVPSDLLVPQSDIGFAVYNRKSAFRGGTGDGKDALTINDVPEVGVTRQVGHQTFHPFDTLDEVDDHLFRGLFVQRSDDVVDSLAEDSRQTVTHGGMGKGILVVSSERGPGRVLRQRGNCVSQPGYPPRQSLEVTHLGVNLGWGSRPGGASIVPPLRKVGQREGNLLGCPRLASRGKDGGLIVRVDSKVVVCHNVLLFASRTGG